MNDEQNPIRRRRLQELHRIGLPRRARGPGARGLRMQSRSASQPRRHSGLRPAMASGSIGTYVEYSGTALTAILHQPLQSSAAVNETVTRAYAKRGLHWGPNLGFNDTFAMIVRRNSGLRTISDLQRVEATFQPGFGYEFASRPDGWNRQLQQFSLHFAKSPKTIELGLTYK